MITIDGSILKIPEIQTSKGKINAKDIDLTLYEGQVVRVFVDNNLNIVINPQYDCYWQIVEIRVPYQFRDEETEELLPLDLSGCELITYELQKEV